MFEAIAPGMLGALLVGAGSAGSGEDLLGMITGAGPVVQGVLYILIFSSVASWGVILYKARRIRTARKASDRFMEIFWDSKNLTAIYAASQEMGASPVAQVFRAGYQELGRLTRARRQADDAQMSTELSGVANVERAMRRAATQQLTDLERATTFLATTASAAPFIGLFGTVWGIMHAFLGLSATQSSTIQAVAPGIAEALIATAAGLFAAIPAVVAYNSFSRQIRVLSAEMDNFAFEFLNIAERHFLN
jgi:biopolymer transport protein TolQ